MNLIKVTCELRYSERMPLFKGYELIYNDLQSKTPEHPDQWIMPGLRIEDKDKKAIWLIDPVRSAIDVEQPNDIETCKKAVIGFFEVVHKRIDFPSIARYGMRTTWIKEYHGSFQDFVDTFKQKFYADVNLLKKASDVGVMFNLSLSADQKISVTFGPMEYEQLKIQFIRFESHSFPKIFLYTDVDFGDTLIKSFSHEHITNFFDKAISEGQKISTELGETFGV